MNYRTLSHMLILTLVVVHVAACSAATPSALFGKWLGSADGVITLELTQDGKFEFQWFKQNYTGTYEVKDNKIRLMVSGDPNKQIGLIYKFESDDKMLIGFEQGYANTYIVFVKKSRRAD